MYRAPVFFPDAVFTAWSAANFSTAALTAGWSLTKVSWGLLVWPMTAEAAKMARNGAIVNVRIFPPMLQLYHFFG